ncbi:MAG TPA: amino acid adenylation domain-containing protein [Pyrinomonadaceae bacterium]|nr:amino acid adenylation domain-containing protein [Pyrinomonadaceae bacterium]
MKPKNVEDIYPLAPMQQGVLFHNLHDPGAAMYFEIITWTIHGEVNIEAFAKAWQSVVDRHPILRTFFVWEGLDEPLQVVRKQVKLPLNYEDWRGRDPEVQQQQVEEFYVGERARGFDLSTAPLLRVALIQLEDEVYRFVWSYHHVLIDGWSSSVIFNDAFNFYQRLAQGQELKVEPGRPFRDYIVWLRKQDLSEAERFWRRTLQGFAAPTVLGIGNGKSSATHTYAEEQLLLSVETSEALQAFARRHQLTLNTLFQGAWAMLLNRYSGVRDVVFGVAVSGRPPDLPGVESMVGMLVNTLPARIAVRRGATLLSWLREIQERQVTMRKYEYTPLLQIQQWSEVPKGTQLFESIVGFENHPIDSSLATSSGKAELRDIEHYHTATGYALNVMIDPGRELLIKIMYDVGRFEAAAIGQMLNHFQVLLESSVANPEAQLDDLEMLTAGERHELLNEWSGSRTAYPREACIQELFEAEVERTPGAVAVIFGEQRLTYRELNERANQLAHHLRGLGVGPEVLVALCVERSLELIVGLLGILKAGGAYAPLDPNYPAERLTFMLEDSAAPVLLTQEFFANILPAKSKKIVCLDTDWDRIAASSRDNPDNQNSADSLAYLMYTSGSTGRPKGIGIPHRGVVRLVRNTNYYDFGPGETLLQLAPISFDASTFEVWGSLLNGGRLVVMPPDSPSLEELGRALRQHGITTLFLTTGLFHLMANGELESLLGLRRLLSGGEVLSPQAVKQVVEAGSALTFCDIYGPTENTTYSTFYPVQSGTSFGATVPIGKPINNTQVYVLDSELRPTPAGVPGELYLGGDGLARGYHNRPELTAERFIPDPFSGVSGVRLYRTGDRVRFLPDGNIEFIGRFDNQVKVRGFRIELGEIETVLSRHADIKEVAVEMRGEVSEEKRLVAYVVSNREAELSTEELRDYLSEKLPDYMVPNNFVMLERMPLTNNGKVDRKALPEPDSLRPELAEGYVAPRTHVEHQLSVSWTKVLGIERVGVNDNFFELGGHSLLATQLVSTVREKFQIELPLHVIFNSPTIGEMATYLTAILPDEHEVSAPVVTPVTRERDLPLSFAQRRMWFLNQLEPESAYYNVPLALRLTGRLDTDALEKAINEVIRRHEVLRTTFATAAGEPVQVINEAVYLTLTVEDISRAGEDRAVELALEESTKPFDLSRGPLLRMRLLKLGPENFVALFTVHHIIADGWSMGVLVREVAALYAAFVEGKPSPLPELPLQYADFAAWQQERLRGSVLEDHFDYWKTQLSGAPFVLDLPSDKPRLPVQKFHGARALFSVPKPVTAQLLAISRQENATLFMTLLAAFNVLLHRYTGQQDILIGTPIANRNRAEIEGLIGFFVNTLVLRAKMESDESFLSLLRQIRATTLAAYAHQDLPFDKLVQELQPERDMSRSPLFQVMLVLQNAPQPAFELPGLTLSAFETRNRTAKFDLMLTTVETPDGLQCELEYDTDLFEGETIDRMIGNFQVLLESMTRDPLQNVSTIKLLTQDQRAQLLEEWNQTDAEYARDTCLHQLFELQVDRTPDAACLLGDGVSLTYRQLDHRANQLAHRLIREGIGCETRVGILLERSVEQAVALLGILKAGACYVPLDPDSPRERLHYMIDDANVSLIVTQAALANDLLANGPRVMCLDDCAAELERESAVRPATSVTPDNLAYVIYTSGSTGRPKGAMLQHRSIVNCIAWMQHSYQLDQSDRFLFKTTLNFDPSIWEFFWPLMVGAQVIVARPEAQSNPALLVETIIRYGATVAYLVPSLLTHFLEEQKLDQISSLRYLICGGESLTRETVERCHERLPKVELHHSYGPTETSIAASETVCRVDSPHRITPIGRPLANVRLYVLDERMQPVPLGARGELYIGGECVGRGYLNRPALTAEKFGPDPFAVEVGARLYRTGDRVRYLPDGQLEFTGRSDDQVKIRGMRIELGEIEAVLGEQEGVSAGVVIVSSQDSKDQRLVAYVTTEPERVLSAEDLRRGLKEQLPDYMVPSTFVMLDQMPLMPNGKINRRELPVSLVAHRNGYVAPANAVEEMLADIWQEVLDRERVSAADNFFELGGHSLLATRVTSRVREMFGVELPLRSIFEAPTISGMSRKILANMLGGELQQSRHITKVPRDGDLPLSFAQERLWFLEQLESAGLAYHVPMIMRIDGQLDVTALEKTLAELVQRHESLRTTFINIDGEPRQNIAASIKVDLPIIDLSTLPEDERDEAAVRHATEQVQQTFDLSSGPLLRAALLRLSAERHVFALTLHHIISDGWSAGVLGAETVSLYKAYAAGEESPLEELPVQYADYAVWQRDWLSGAVLENQLEYWRGQLRDLPTAIELPTDYPRPPVQSFRGDTIEFSLTRELTAKLKEISRHENVTLFMTLLAAFRILLYRSTGQETIAIGTPIANRQDSAIENLIGFFVNTLVLRIDLAGNMSFKELLNQVREVTLGAYAHQDVPFEKLVEELQPERVRNLHPLFQVMFAMQNAPVSTLDIPGLTFSAQEFEHGATRFDLECHMRELDNRLYGQLVFSTDLFKRETAERMIQHFKNLLEAVTAKERIATLPLFTEEEKQELLAACQGPVVEFLRDRCIHQLFEAQAERTPNDVALVFHDEKLTYRELDQRATQLARYLRKQGIGLDTVVGVCIERSLAMMVGVLGVLKAGGAYLGLDPAYPQERLQLMLDDTCANVLITQERFSSRFEASGTTQIHIDKDWPEICAEREAALPANMSTDQLAFVVFTSGSTGRPKGVAITHIALSNLISWQAARNTAKPQPRTLQFASLSFDVSFQEIFSTWALGGTLVVADEDARHDPKALLRVLTEQRIQSVDVPYVMLQYLAEIATTENVALPDLRYFIAAGEQLKITPTIRRFFEPLGDCAVDNHYGPSETHVVCTYMLEGPSSTWPELPPIGRPMNNARIYVLDKQMQPAPFGVVGEVYIGGAQLARCYLNQPALTAERFVPDPFSSSEPGRRLYRTGDLACLRADGNFEFIGRNDFQIKLRGHRIELGEVEAALRRERFVREAVVKTHQNACGEVSLVAYLLVEPDSSLQLNELQGRLEKQLPPHMIPSAFVCLDEFPLTPSGKLDRRALRATDDLLLQTSYTGYVAPRTPHEEMVAAIWAEVLNLARVGATDNFFHLGGHSLLATRVMARVRKAFGIELPLHKLFEAPTVVRFTEEIVAALAAEPEQKPLPLIEHLPDTEAPLSFEQERLWVWDQFNPGSPLYNLTNAFRLQGQLNTTALEKTFNEIVRRHDALRTTFQASKQGPTQIVSSWTPVSLPVTDLSKLTEDDKEAEMKRQQEMHARHNFDLSRGPLMLISLLRLSEAEHVALITMHHIISDGWSTGVLLQEVTGLYEAFNTDRPAPLGELPIQYPDFARWQRRWLETRSLPYWTKQLDPLPSAIELPHDYERPDPMSFRGNSISFNIPGELLANLQALSRSQNVTLYMTLLAAFKTLLHRYSGQTDIVIGGASANRTQIELEKLIGFFVNMLVLRTDVSGNPKFTELLQRVREVTLGAYAHQHTPYAALVTELKLKREWNRNPLFQVVFILQNAPLGEVEVQGLSVSPVALKSDFSPFDLLISLWEKENGIEGTVAYSEELFKRETIELLFDRYSNLLESIVANPEERLSQLELHGYVETADYSLPQFLTDLRPREMDKLLMKIEISGN